MLFNLAQKEHNKASWLVIFFSALREVFVFVVRCCCLANTEAITKFLRCGFQQKIEWQWLQLDGCHTVATHDYLYSISCIIGQQNIEFERDTEVSQLLVLVIRLAIDFELIVSVVVFMR